MEEKESQREYSFSLKNIALLEKTLSLKAPVNKGDEFDFNVSLQIDGKPKSTECFHVMNVQISRKDEKDVLGSITLGCTFSIPHYQEYLHYSKDNASLPEELINLLNAVIIGTMRGVMFSEFRGTFLSTAYLPVLDPRKLLKEE
jgi:hypothetical protein